MLWFCQIFPKLFRFSEQLSIFCNVLALRHLCAFSTTLLKNLEKTSFSTPDYKFRWKSLQNPFSVHFIDQSALCPEASSICQPFFPTFYTFAASSSRSFIHFCALFPSQYPLLSHPYSHVKATNIFSHLFCNNLTDLSFSLIPSDCFLDVFFPSIDLSNEIKPIIFADLLEHLWHDFIYHIAPLILITKSSHPFIKNLRVIFYLTHWRLDFFLFHFVFFSNWQFIRQNQTFLSISAKILFHLAYLRIYKKESFYFQTLYFIHSYFELPDFSCVRNSIL